MKRISFLIGFLLATFGAFAQKQVLYQGNWKNDLDGWKVKTYKGQQWGRHPKGGALQISGKKHETEAWIISPAITCQNKEKVTVVFQHGFADGTAGLLEAFYTFKKPKNPRKAKWEKLEIQEPPVVEGNWKNYTVEKHSVKVEGKELWIAFRYTSPDRKVSKRVRIKKFKVR